MTSLLTSCTALAAVLPRLSTRKLARDIGRELLFPAALHLRLDRHRLQGLDAGDALDQEGLVLGAAPELLVEPAAEERRHAGRDADIERERAQHDAGQERRVEEHHRQEHEGEEQVEHEGQRRAGEEIADVLELAHPRHAVAGAPRLEIGERQASRWRKSRAPSSTSIRFVVCAKR